MQNALKEIFGPMFESMLKGEMNHHLGYESNDKTEKETENRRNGYGRKTIKTSSGEVDIKMPRDRDGSFNPELISKQKKDVSAIENKVISMYARGRSQIFLPPSRISMVFQCPMKRCDIKDQILPELEEWQTRPYNCFCGLYAHNDSKSI